MEAANLRDTNPQQPQTGSATAGTAASPIATQNPISQAPAETASTTPTSSPTPTPGNVDTANSAISKPMSQEAKAPEPRKKDDIDRLSGIRLGNAHGLFIALRAKHNPTATHCLKTAIACSGWASSLRLPEQLHTILEVAALLHDVGKIGVPDSVLVKSSSLERDEIVQLDRYRTHTLEILAGAGAVRELIDTVYYASAWFDGRNRNYDRYGDQLPITSRMLAIVDAYDSMTTEQAHRQALSPDQAIAELFRNAGSQFDPRLASNFADYLTQNGSQQTSQVANRWLNEVVHQYDPNLFANASCFSSLEESSAQLFHSQLVETLNEAVIFVDAQKRVVSWNRAAERITGIASSGVCHREWIPELIKLRDEAGNQIQNESCPVAMTLRTGESNRFVGQIISRSERNITVDVRLRAVVGKDSVLHGAMIVMEDLSDEVSLAERLEALNAKVAVDPLTKVANRAEIDRVHQELFVAAGEQHNTYSMVICDLDFFKRINDDYGHPAGDEALMQFASLMKRHKRPGDLVGRYGGEEFVMLCVDTDVNQAAKRADEVRLVLQSTPIEALGNRCITASFGVTQLQPGDSPDTMLRRADRALLKAKETGRNKVVSIGGVQQVEKSDEPINTAKAGGWFARQRQEIVSDTKLFTTVPMNLAVEKLRGFIADRGASILEVDGEAVQFKVDGKSVGLGRRQTDRPIPFIVDMSFAKIEQNKGEDGRPINGTEIGVRIRPIRQRDRRAKNIQDQVANLIESLKAYFMATRLTAPEPQGLERAATEPGRRE